MSLSSCSSTYTHWQVSREGLQPSRDATIERIYLVDSSIIEFDDAHGWYDAERAYIEGVTSGGMRDTISLSKVQSVDIEQERTNNTGITIAGITLFLLALGAVVLFAAFGGYSTVSRGCVVLIQFAILSAATMAAIVLIVLYR
ncbi:MAG TPA: hypothetical protein VG537_08690 [Candidatus Kapabacteria bacterium]|nr:hypothetical protein [Candidatus Kapabacteria bacterium]